MPRSFSGVLVMPDFSSRAQITELMDDPSRPLSEFEQAYRELASINRRLGNIRAIERFLPSKEGLRVLDVAAGGCDIGDVLVETRSCRVVSLDLNAMGLKRTHRTWPVVGDGKCLPFADGTFDAVLCTLSFHHLTNSECEEVLREMWRTSRGCILVNDLHRHPVAYASIWILARLFSKSVMVKHDGPASVRRAFRPEELQEIARRAGIRARVHRSFPFRLVLVGEK
jgi:ubiquinone/menaquinone biosynthesis C-methylase UbiE